MTDLGLKSGLAEESNLAICCLLGNPATDATINPEKNGRCQIRAATRGLRPSNLYLHR